MLVFLKQKFEFTVPFWELYKMQIFLHCLLHIDGLVQESRNSSVLAMELRLSCINPSLYSYFWKTIHHVKSYYISLLFSSGLF